MNVPQEMVINKAHWNYILKNKVSSLDVNDEADKHKFGSWVTYQLNKDKILMYIVLHSLL